MATLPLLLILIIYGTYRFCTALQTGVLMGSKLGARRANQPVTFAVSMIILGGAIVACVWMVVGSIHSANFSSLKT